MKVINGKTYNLWQQFWDQREEWIGGRLVDEESDVDTIIEDVIFEENGDDSAKFGFKGKDDDIWFDVKFGGVEGVPCPVKGGICFSSFGGYFYAVKPKLGETNG